MLEKLWPFAYTAAARGSRDRRRNHPAAGASIPMQDYNAVSRDGELHPFEATMVADAEARIDRRMRGWEKRRHQLKSKAEILAIEIRHLLGRRKRLTESREGRHDLRRPHRRMGVVAYLALLALLGVTEYAVNFESFNGWFLYSDSWSTFFKFGWKLYVAAALPSALLPFFGHLSGSSVKHARREPMPLTDRVVLGVVVAMALGLIYAMAELRAMDLGRHAAAAVAGAGRATSGAYWGILMLNLAAFVAGAGLSYLRHGDDEDHEDSDSQEQRLERKLARARRRWARIAGKHDQIRGVLICDVKALQQDTLSRVYEYRDFNLMGASQPLSSGLSQEVGGRFFQPRDFSSELSRTPPAISDVYEEGNSEPGEARPSPAAESAADLNGGSPPADPAHLQNATEEDDVRH